MHKARRLVLAVALATGGCNLAPRYTPPAPPATPAAFLETGPWTPARPDEASLADAWWTTLGDPQLDALEKRLDAHSPALAVIVARHDAAEALAWRARADRLPQLGAHGGATRERTVSPSTGRDIVYNDYAVGVSASYDLDLWGRLRNLAAQSRAEAEASAADVAAARLGLHAALATDYFRMRGLDATIDTLRQTIDTYGRALQLTLRREADGMSTGLDVARARAQRAASQAELEQQLANRALLQHAIAALAGESASSFEIAPDGKLEAPPNVPVYAPSVLLQRRPDVAAAERRVAAANAGIGAARAAFYPDLALGGSGGFEATMGALLSAASKVWALGPAVVLQPVFDGGARRADLSRSHAQFDEAAAAYRQVTLAAFRDVEDQLALVNRLARAHTKQAEAFDAARRANRLATLQYRDGAIDYLQVVTAQTAEQQAHEALIALQVQRLVASVNLVGALGGGWTATGGAS